MVAPCYLNAESHELLQLVHDAQAIYTCRGGCTVKKLPENVAVKYGVGMMQRDYENLKFAHDYLHAPDVQISEPYLFFRSDGVGYLFMEFVPGKTLHDFLEGNPGRNETIIAKVRNVIENMHSVERERPGPITGIDVRGFPWGFDSVHIASREDLELQIDRRLALHGERMSLEGERFVLCHGDLTTGNILVTTEERISLVDWSTAAFYPKYFEIAALAVSDDWNVLSQVFEYGDEVTDKLRKLRIVNDQSHRRALCVYHSPS